MSQKWRSLGVLVEAPPPLPWAISHAALPVVHADPSRLRLLCSSRDDEGRSQIVSASLDLAGESTSFDSDVVLGLGALGTFDDNGVTTSCLVDHDGRLFLYYTGWNRGVTVPFYLAVGCAVSEDGGASFKRVSHAPVLGRTAIDPLLTASPCVLIENETWRMWYVSGSEWFATHERVQHRYHIRYAESADGVNWLAGGLVCIDYRDLTETAIARPCVVKDGDLYRMWYSRRGHAYRIGYAESPDGYTWTRLDDEVEISPTGEWDSDMQAYPFVFDHDRTRHMLFNGNGFGATGIGHAVLDMATRASPPTS